MISRPIAQRDDDLTAAALLSRIAGGNAVNDAVHEFEQVDGEFAGMVRAE